MSEEKQFEIDVPEIPSEIMEFANGFAELAKLHGIAKATMEVKVDTGPGTRFWKNYDSQVKESVTVSVSLVDGRGRPRTQILVSCDINFRTWIVNEPDSSS